MAGLFDHKYPITNLHELDLTWIIKEVEEMKNKFIDWEKTVNELKAALPRIDELETRMAEAERRLNDIDIVLSDLLEATDDLESRVRILETQIEGFYKYVDSMIAWLKAIHDEDFTILLYKLNQAKAEIENQIEYINYRLDNIDTSVYNPWLAEYVGPQQNEDYIFNHLADECLTASEYASLALSADEYEEIDITSNEYQEFGKEKLHFRWVFSPAYGFRQEINNVLTSIVNFLAGTLSASEYADLDLTADQYAALDLTSEAYFRYNPLSPSGYVEVSPEGIGLTVGQYEHLRTV